MQSLVARHHVALDKHQPNIVKVNDCNVVDPTLNGSLVYIQGRLNVPIPIRLDEYKITVHAVKLKRRVQMYQWSELPKDRRVFYLFAVAQFVVGSVILLSSVYCSAIARDTN